jgi:hypothetical protein
MSDAKSKRGWCDWCKSIEIASLDCDCGLRLCEGCFQAHACGKDDVPDARTLIVRVRGQEIFERLERIGEAARAGLIPRPGLEIAIDYCDEDSVPSFYWDLDFTWKNTGQEQAAELAMDRADAMFAAAPDLGCNGEGGGNTCLGLSGSVDLPGEAS